jgi:GntR family transcriptional repressor for pyruvate dehydrogenase complex
MRMERVGLVARVEEQLERVISLGQLPECGRFGSEETLARIYGVSRGTVREALRRLAARGLVAQHPGRKTRAVALDESLTLENLGLALHHERSPASRRLLEGYFSLKRQVTVELLAGCATHASPADLDRLGMACFALWDAARWEPGERCAQREFELLKLAARVTNRPGHLLLLQSMQRAMRGMAARVLPLVDGEAVRQWAQCAMHALGERDAEALQRKLPSLLRACDERVLGRLAASPTIEEHGLARPAPAAPQDEAPEACLTLEQRGLGPRAHAAGEDLPGAAFANLSDCRTGFCASPPEEATQPEPPSADACGPTHVTALREGGPLHGTRDHPPPAGPHGLAPRHSPPTSQESPLLSSNSPRVLLSDEGRPASDASAPTEHPR